MPTNKVMTLSSESIEHFQSSLIARGRSANTVRAYVSDLTLLLAEMGQTPPEDFDRAATMWLNKHRTEWSPKTVQRRVTTLRTWAKWARVETDDLSEYHAPTPARAIPHPLPEGIPGVLAMIEEGKNARQRALVSLCGLAGLRLAEALAMRPMDFNLTDRTITVRGKGDRTRSVPLSTTCYRYVHDALLDAVLDKRTTVVDYGDRFAREAITAMGRRALGHHVSSHDLRSTFLTAVYAHTHDLRAAQELAGHATSATTEIYTAVPMDSMRDAVEGAMP